MNPLGLLIVVAATAVLSVALTSWNRRYMALQRLADHDDVHRIAAVDVSGLDNALARWLSRAGYRGDNAVALFISATAGCAVLGLVAGQLYRLTVQATLVDRIGSFPGGVGDAMTEILRWGPWILFVLGGLLPMSIVRTRRRARVRAIEQDLPLALEMLATMADAGLSFDAALGNIIRARGTRRPLIAEFLKFQIDMLAGMPRGQALRQLARRVHIPALTGFTSALVQAELVGASIAETLQHQAADLRQRRREEALLHAQAMPVKLVFPLVICFLPGVFLSTLAPAVYQMLQVADSVLRSGQ